MIKVTIKVEDEHSDDLIKLLEEAPFKVDIIGIIPDQDIDNALPKNDL